MIGDFAEPVGGMEMEVSNLGEANGENKKEIRRKGGGERMEKKSWGISAVAGRQECRWICVVRRKPNGHIYACIIAIHLFFLACPPVIIGCLLHVVDPR
jgi:hypothetical protein